MSNASEHRKEIEDAIVENMISALEKEKITEEDMTIISGYVLDNIDSATNYTTTIEFLQDISTRWDIFESILDSEKAGMTRKIESEVAEGVLILAQHGKIENAIKLAQSMTNNQTQ